MKKLTFILLTILLLNIDIVKAETINFDKKGSLDITLIESEDNEKVQNASISVIKIADAKSINSNLVYEYVSDLDDCDISLKNVTIDGLVNDLLKYISDNNIELSKETLITNENGNVKFNDLSLGLYLVMQEKEVEGYSSFNPYLVTIPTIEDNKWIYDIESEPKTEIIKVIDLTINKVWKNNRTKNPSSVEISLLKGEDVIDTVTLNEENNWSYTFNRIKKSDDYSVVEVNVPNGYRVSYTNNGYVFTVINSAKLPQTGFHTFIIPLLAVIGMMLVICGIIIEKKGKRYE